MINNKNYDGSMFGAPTPNAVNVLKNALPHLVECLFHYNEEYETYKGYSKGQEIEEDRADLQRVLFDASRLIESDWLKGYIK